MSSIRLFVVAGLLVAIGLALFLSPLASSEPDGLERVATEKGFAQSAEEHALEEGPLAGYSVRGIDDDRLSRAVSGFIGVLVTFGVGLAIFGLLRATRRRQQP